MNTDDGTIILPANITIMCNYGCDTSRDICHKWPGDAIPAEHFLLFEIFAIVIITLVIFRLDTPTREVKIFDIFVSLLAFILFATLGLQAYNVIDLATGEAVPVNLVVAFNYGMAFFALIPFFFNLFKFIRSVIEESGPK